MQQMSVTGILKTLIPISRFNKGEAYELLMEMLSDFILKEEAEARMDHYDASENRTQEQMMQEFGISQSELDAVEVELE